MNCKSCRHSKYNNDSGLYHCHRYPPTLVSDPMVDEEKGLLLVSSWPVVDESQHSVLTCGEFSPEHQALN